MLGRRRRRGLGAALAAALAASGAPAAAAPSEPLAHEGRWITDASGRVVVLHGAAVVVGGAFDPQGEELTPEQMGFGRADAAFLAEHGFNVVRLGLFVRGLSPEPGVIDDEYLASIVRSQRLLAEHGILTLVDVHQDQLSPHYSGRGFPDWFLIDDGLPNTAEPFPLGYFVNAALNRAYDSLWGNAPGPGGVGLRDRFIEIWTEIVRAFRDESFVLGYDIFNEPWPGSQWPGCLSVEGCGTDGFDQTALTEFSNAVIDGIREVDPKRLSFYEPNLLFDIGAATRHRRVSDPNAGLSFHHYCLPAGNVPDPLGVCGSGGDRMVFEHAEEHSDETGAALLMTEFGDSEDPAPHRRIADLADEYMVGWTNWAYMGSTGQIKINDGQPPTPPNLRQERLDPVVRAYPRVVAGVPLRWDWQQEARTFELAYNVRRVDGTGRWPAGTESELFVPRRHFPDGYGVELEGAELVGRRPPAGLIERQVLRVRSCAGARRVVLRVTPQPSSPVLCAKRSTCGEIARGTSGPDRLDGSRGRDDIRGFGGDDRIVARAGSDCVRGGGGDDEIAGRKGQDRLSGGAGRDRIRSRDGLPDLIRCGPGFDVAISDHRDRRRGCEVLRLPLKRNAR